MCDMNDMNTMVRALTSYWFQHSRRMYGKYVCRNDSI